MKKLLYLLSLTLVVSLFGCSDERVLPDREGDGAGTQTGVSFVFKGINGGPVVYSESPIATDKEYEVADMDVYMFEYTTDATGKFLARFSKGDYVATTSGTNMTLTLKSLEEYGTGTKTFYFVANPSPTTAIAATANVTTETAFRELLTLEQAVATDTAAKLDTPLLFTGKTNEPIDPTGAITASTVTMKRRVARFDLVNNYANVDVTHIFVSNANIQGYIFGNATGNRVMPTGKYSAITYLRGYETVGADQMMRSVFYSYPGRLKEGNMEIALQAEINGGTPQLLYLDVDVEIKANHRYKLVIDQDLQFGNLSLSLVFADWDEEDEIVDVNKKKAMTITDFKVNKADPDANVWDETTLVYNDIRVGDKFQFIVRNPREIDYKFERIEGSAAGITTEPTMTSVRTLTYAAEYYHECEVTFPVLAQPKYLKYKLTVSNRANPLERKEMFFEYPIEAAFAKSNIVWDATGSKLTFAVTESDNTAIPANVRGMFFRPGSLVPTQSTGNLSVPFAPAGVTVPTTFKDIPYYPCAAVLERFDQDYLLFLNAAGYDAATGRGDICRYMSDQTGWVDGRWRIPTMQEYIDLADRKDPEQYTSTASVQVTNGMSTHSGGWISGKEGVKEAGNSFVKSPTGLAVFIPATGYNNRSSVNSANSNYWAVGSDPSMITSTNRLNSIGASVYWADGYLFGKKGTNYPSSITLGAIRCIRE